MIEYDILNLSSDILQKTFAVRDPGEAFCSLALSPAPFVKRCRLGSRRGDGEVRIFTTAAAGVAQDKRKISHKTKKPQVEALGGVYYHCYIPCATEGTGMHGMAHG